MTLGYIWRPIFVLLTFFLFRSPIFVPLTFSHLQLGSPSPNGRQCPPIFVPLTFFLFRPPIFVPPFLFHSPIFVWLTFLHLHLGYPSPNGRESPPIFVPQFLFCNFCSADVFALALTNFCFAIFVSQFLFCCPFCTCTWHPRHLMAKSPHQFLFHNFCSAHQFLFCWPFCTCIGIPITQWPRVPANFCSTHQFLFRSPIFVLLTFLHLHLSIFVPLTNFCSADLFALALTNFCSAYQFLFRWPFCTCTWGTRHPMADSAPPISTDLFTLALSPPIFVPLFLFCHFCSTHLFALTTVWGSLSPSNTNTQCILTFRTFGTQITANTKAPLHQPEKYTFGTFFSSASRIKPLR